MKIQVGIRLVVLAAGVVAVSACQTYYNLPESAEMPQSTAASPLVLVPGDEIDVRFRYWPEFDDVQTIRPDGKISLQLVQGVDAAGKTPEELQNILIELYKDKVRDPDIVVIVRTLVNQKIYVSGEVQQPGLFDMRGRMTALEAIMMAGGFDTGTAHLRNVVIIRHIDGQRYAGAVDMRGMLKDPESNPIYLQQNDIVYVPRTAIVQLNQFVDQYLNEMMPTSVLQSMALIDDVYPDVFGDDEDDNNDAPLTLPLDFSTTPANFPANPFTP